MTNKEAIAILTHNWKYRELIDNPYQYEALDHAIKALEERPQGEWIIHGEEQGALGITYKIRKCNKCGWEHSLVIPDNFCPKCGAKMTKEAENEI